MKKPVRLLSYKDLKERGIRFSSRHLLRLEDAGKFPKRVRISTNAVDWVEEEIEKHIAGLMEARDVVDGKMRRARRRSSARPSASAAESRRSR